ILTSTSIIPSTSRNYGECFARRTSTVGDRRSYAFLGDAEATVRRSPGAGFPEHGFSCSSRCPNSDRAPCRGRRIYDDPSVDQALAVFVNAIAKPDPRMTH